VLGEWQHPTPVVLGHEGSGIVTAVGSGVTGLALGPVVAALRALVPEGLDYVFDAIGKIETTEQAIAALGLGGSAVVVGLPPAGQRARFDPLALAESDQRILGSNYGSITPQRDIPRMVDLFMSGALDLESMVSARRPLAEAAEALRDLASGRALRQLLICAPPDDEAKGPPRRDGLAL
jgi:S-(hydroxymethyl)glutathione dehydrogenase / alcohol dehydrogenase